VGGIEKHTTPISNTVNGSHSLTNCALVVVVAVYGGGVTSGVGVGVGLLVAVMVGVIVGVTLKVGVGVGVGSTQGNDVSSIN